jgi:hypothetical protein
MVYSSVISPERLLEAAVAPIKAQQRIAEMWIVLFANYFVASIKLGQKHH